MRMTIALARSCTCTLRLRRVSVSSGGTLLPRDTCLHQAFNVQMARFNIAPARAVDREFNSEFGSNSGGGRPGGCAPPPPPASWGAAPPRPPTFWGVPPPGPPKRRSAPLLQRLVSFPTLQSGVVRICVKSASPSPSPPPHPSFLTHVLPRPCQKMSRAKHDCKRQHQNAK